MFWSLQLRIALSPPPTSNVEAMVFVLARVSDYEPNIGFGGGGSEDTHLKLSIGHGCPDANF